MSTIAEVVIYLLLGLAAVYLLFGLAESLRSYFKLRGKRLVKCPETEQTEAVELDARRAARETLFGTPRLRLRECSRWPERQNCGQECLGQIEATPEDCLVRNIVERWYSGKVCAYCKRPIHEIEWQGHKPALMDPDRQTVCWDAIPAEKLPEVFNTYLPVCWDCHITETFRRQHPELLTDRPAH
jgi:hypothetical protein